MSTASGEQPLQPHLPSFSPRDRETIYFDLETQHSFDEVGGRHHVDRLKLSVAVTHSGATNQFTAYTEEQVQDLLQELRQAQLVVGFNIRHFDYRVLEPYARFPLSDVSTLDIMDHVVRQLGFRLSLDALAAGTLGEGKTGDGLQAIRWFREGAWEKLVSYCRKDVEIVRRLYEHGSREGCLFYFDRNGRKKRLPVNWRL